MQVFFAVLVASIAVCTAALIIYDPAKTGLRLLAIGSLIQLPLIAYLLVPAIGPTARYAALWKEAIILLMLVGMILARRRIRTDDAEDDRRLPRFVAVACSLYAVHIVLLLVFPELSSDAVIGREAAVARLAGARQWLVPVYLLAFGALLARSSVSSRYIRNAVMVYGAVVASFAIAGWLLTPIEFWAQANSLVSGIGNANEQDVQFDGLHSYFFGTAVPRAAAPFGSPLATAFSLTLPLLLALHEPRSRQRNANVIILVLALGLTQTRAIILALILVFCWVQLRKLKLGQLIVTAYCVIALAFVPGVSSAIQRTVTLEDPSARAHVEHISDGLSQLAANPAGHGLGQGGQVGRVYGDALAGGENLYLVAGNERGWLGLTLLIVLLLSLFTSISTRPGEHAPLADSVRLTLLVLVMASFTTEHAIAFNSSWVFWTATGFCVGLGLSQGHSRPKRVYREQSDDRRETGARR